MLVNMEASLSNRMQRPCQDLKALLGLGFHESGVVVDWPTSLL